MSVTPRRSSGLSTRFSSIVEDKPIYLEQHSCAALALVKLTDYDSWSICGFEWLVTVLHGIHLRIDALVQQYGLFKVSCYGGEFMVVANVSKDTDRHAPDSLLQFANDVLKELVAVKLPTGKQLRIQVALSTGPLWSAILGKTALKYTVHGCSEVMVRRLLRSSGRDGCVVATKQFLDCLVSGLQAWRPLAVENKDSDVPLGDMIYLFEKDRPDGAALASSSPRNETSSRTDARGLRRMLPSLCFDDVERERSFRLYQAEWFTVFDMLYMSFSISLIAAAILRASRIGISSVALAHLVLSAIGTAIPLGGVVFCGDFYKKHRQKFLVFLRVMKLITIGLFGFQQKASSLEPLILNYAVLNGMHAIGAQVVLPTHLTLQVLSVAIIALKSIFLCRSTDSDINNEGCNPMTSALILFLITLLVPSFIGYRVEKQQRSLYSHGPVVRA